MGKTAMQRESGYYRVKIGGIWTIADYNSTYNYFNLSGSDEQYLEHEFDFIDWDNPIDTTPSQVFYSWIDERIKPKTSDCVAVMVSNLKFPTIGWYNKKLEEWVLEDRDARGKVLKWFPLPNYR